MVREWVQEIDIELKIDPCYSQHGISGKNTGFGMR